MDAAEKLAPEVGTAAACRAMGVSRATVYRHRRTQTTSAEEPCKGRQPRALCETERQRVRDVLHSERFVVGVGAGHCRSPPKIPEAQASARRGREVLKCDK